MRINFSEEIERCVDTGGKYKMLLCGRCCYVLGVAKIICCDSEKIILQTQCKSRLIICGNRLEICKLSLGDVGISGKVNCVEIERGEMR